MDSNEATRVVFSRIQTLDPENASKIMGLLLIQDHGEKEMVRLAFGPESVLHSVILKARKELGFTSNTPSTPSTPSSPSPISGQNSYSYLSASSRFLNGTSNRPSPLSIPNPLSSWGNSSNCSDYQNTEDLISRNAHSSNNTAPFARSAPSSYGMSNLRFGSSLLSMNSLAPPFHCTGVVACENDLIDEFHLHEQLSFLNDGLLPPLVPESPDFFYPGQPDLASSSFLDSSVRTCSMNDICLGGGADDVGGGFGWKPCLYFARGYCKKGTSCRFEHRDDGEAMVGSLDSDNLEMMTQCQEVLQSKSAHQQRLAAASQLMGSSSFPYTPNNYMNFLLQQQQNNSPRAAAAAAALLMRDEINKFGRNRLERNEFLMNGGMEMVNPASHQIYLTFPADSTFKEEDVSNYFSMFGPVQDVRIPYQQKRMFGFVTFLYPDTVKLIHAKGNPHFVCDARVLVKPYKEKGKVADKFRKLQQQMETEEYSSCSPSGFDSREPFDLQLGPPMLYSTQDLLWRRKLEEQADLPQAIELQNHRLMGLQLLDVKRSHHQRSLSTGAAMPSPTHSPSILSHSSFFYPHSDRSCPEEDYFISRLRTPVIVSEDDHQTVNGYEKEREKEKESSDCLSDENGNGKSSPHHEEINFSESLEHNLPDSPFASPKAARVYRTAFSINAADDADKNVQSLVSLDTNNFTLTSS